MAGISGTDGPNFADGLLGGYRSVTQTLGMAQENTMRRHQLEAYDQAQADAKAQQDADDAARAAQGGGNAQRIDQREEIPGAIPVPTGNTPVAPPAAGAPPKPSALASPNGSPNQVPVPGASSAPPSMPSYGALGQDPNQVPLRDPTPGNVSGPVQRQPIPDARDRPNMFKRSADPAQDNAQHPWYPPAAPPTTEQLVNQQVGAPSAPPPVKTDVVAEPPAGDFSSWSDRAAAKYPPKGTTVVQQGALGQDPNQPALPTAGNTPADGVPRPGAFPGVPERPAPPPTPTTRGGPSGGDPLGGVRMDQMPPKNAPSGGGQASLGSKVMGALAMLNPIGSAQAAEPNKGGQGLPQAPVDEGGKPAAGALGGSATAAPPPAPGTPASAKPPPGAPPPQAGQPTPVQAKVAPNQVGPAVQSEPAPSTSRPMFDHTAYERLAQSNPSMRSLVDETARRNGVDPARLALHWNLESGLKPQSEPGDDGTSFGPLQIQRATQQSVDPKFELDATKLPDALELAARIIHRNDSIYGQNTASSVVAYQGGSGSANAFANNHEQAMHAYPRGAAYLARAFPGEKFDQSAFPAAMNFDGPGLIRAGLQDGPNGFIDFMFRTGPKGMSTTDLWRGTERNLIALAAMKGDVQGMQHARDFIAQVSQQGSSNALMAAHKAMTVGDTTTAMQQLALAHAFFPDGTMGQFGVDKSGKIWGQRVDEHDPDHKIGGRFQVTPDGIQQMLIQTRDPNKYIAMVNEQQKLAADARLKEAQAGYYRSRPEIAAAQADARVAAAEARAGSAREVAGIRADSAEQIAAAKLEAAGHDQTRQLAVDKELQTGDNGGPMFGPTKGMDPIADQQRRGGLETLYRDLRINDRSIAPGQAAEYSKGVLDGRYQLRPVTGGDGRQAVTLPSGQVLAVVSGQAAQRLQHLLKPVAPPAGAPQRGALGSSSAMPSTAIH